MGSVGFSISYASPQPLSDGDRRALHAAVWEVLTEYMAAYMGAQACKKVWDDYIAELPVDERFAHPSEHALTYFFPDHAGCCSCSMEAAFHWSQLAYACQHDRVSQVLQDHGAMPSGDPPRLAELVYAHPAMMLVCVDEALYTMSTTPDFDSDDDGLWGDNTHVAFTDLDDDTRARLRSLAERGMCACAMCTMLRPDAEFEQTMVRSLASDDPAVAETAIWYLRQTARPSIDTALAMAKAATPGHERSHAAAMFEVAGTLPSEHLRRIRTAFDDADSPTLRAALTALAAGIGVGDAAALGQTRVDLLRRALAADPPVCEIAAEFCGYGAPRHGRDELARALAARVGVSEEMDHNVALTLFNLYHYDTAVPQWVIDVLREIHSSGGQALAIVEFALNILQSKDRY